MAKLTIDIARGVFEVEGSEEFVEKYFTEFQPLLATAGQLQPVVQAPSSSPSPSRTPKKTAPKHPKTAGVPEAFAALEEIPLKLQNGLAYSSLKNDQDRLTWSLGFASEQGTTGLMPADVVWLTDHLGVGIKNQNMSVNFGRIRGKGYANQSTQTNKMRITEDGLAYLQTLVTGKGEFNG